MSQTTIYFTKTKPAEMQTVEATLEEVTDALRSAHSVPGGFMRLKDVQGRDVLINPAAIKVIRERDGPPLRS